MNLLDIRKLFVKHCGRYDLVDPDTFADAGANFFIQAGQRMLDRIDRTSAFSQNSVVSVEAVSAGEQIVQFPEVYNILSVEYGSGDSRPFLLKKHIVGRSLRLLSARGTPISWEPAIGQYKPSIEKLRTAMVDIPAHYFEGAQFAFDQTAIRLFPAPANDGWLAITGHFYSSPLNEDVDESVWSIRNPDLLVGSSLWALEVFYRNTEGARDWMNYIREMIVEQDARELEGEIHFINQMEG